jgi:hypothetical protein
MRERLRLRSATAIAVGIALGATMFATPAAGHVGGTVRHLAGHMKNFFYTKQQSDARYGPQAVLPPGKTLKGTFGIEYTAAGAGNRGIATLSFSGYRLTTAPDADTATNIILSGGAPTAACPGSVAVPKAARGNLCIYESFATNVSFRCLVSTGASYACESSDKYGAGYYIESTGAGQVSAVGSWAVTGGTDVTPRVTPRVTRCADGAPPRC